jgi:hypothetical protein
MCRKRLAFPSRLGDTLVTAGGSQWGLSVISNQRYFARRALEEAARANRAASPSAQLWHKELADKFGRLARGECADAMGQEQALA